jgi:hypothetical protein
LNEKTPGREPIILVQIDQDFCKNQYGVAPCTADGPDKCFNTAKSCQDFENYDRGSLTLTFAEPRSNLPRNQNIIPSLRGVNTAPSVINPANGNRSTAPLGQRALASISFEDHPHSDLLVDKYVAERAYDPLKKSTFWAKWLARNPYYQNRELRIYEGYTGQDLGDMRVRHYLIDSVQGPDASGRVQVVAKDPLNLADREKSQVPEASQGRLRLEINETETQIDIAEALLEDYDEAGTVRIGDELISYTSRSIVTVNTVDYVRLAGVERAIDGSIAEVHRADANVQRCVRYTNQSVADVIYDLLTTYANIPESFIDKEAWDEEVSEFLIGFEVSALLSRPQGVSSVLNELFDQVLAYIWWDERDQEIKFRAIRAIPNSGRIDGDKNILADSFNLTTDPRQRYSQIWIYWNKRNLALPLDNESNYDQLRIRADLEVESPELYGESRIRKVFARWIQTDAQAINLAARLLDLSLDNPKKLRLRLDAKDRSFWTADVLTVGNRNLVNEFGDPTFERYQILSAEEVEPGEVVEYQLQNFAIRIARVGFYTEADALNYEQYTEEEIEAQRLSFYSDEDGLMPDGTTGWEYQ